MITLRHAADRGHANHGWLDSWHTFSFADYHDPAHMGFRSLRVINDDTVAGGGGFDTHPHRDMEIISYVLSGALQHRDSLGHSAVMKAGDVQRIAAGTGILHSEFNHSPIEPVHFLQIWILPDRRGVTPGYAQRSFAGVAVGRLHLVASKTGRDGSIAIHQDADLWLAKFGAGDSATFELASGRHAWLHVAEGEVTINGKNLTGGDAAAFDRATSIELLAARPSQVLLFDLN